jgi:dienelactone hydrolase
MRRLFLLPVVAVLLSLVPLAPAQDRKPLAPTDAKAAFLKLLDRPKVKPDFRTEAEPVEKEGLHYKRWSFASEKKANGQIERVPVLVVRRSDLDLTQNTAPVLIVLHGTGGNKDSVMTWLEDLARQGIIGVAIDARYHGDRVPGVKGSTAYVEAISKSWKTPAGQPMEHPFYYDTVWDLWRLIDFLQTVPGVDSKHIGMMGISMGGIQTWLAASVDDRVAVAAPLIGVQSFRWSLENDRWQGRANSIKAAHEAAAKDLGEPMVNRRVCRELWGKVIPGILDDFDCPNLIRLFAPRPLFIANGTLDANCPIEGARIAIAAAEDEYGKAGKKDRLQVVIGEGVGHTVTPEARKACIAFCVKWLKQ